jgi:diguanylate cyclase (GGDEF)-like protein
MSESSIRQSSDWTLLNVLPDQAAVVDADGLIVKTNDAWKEFTLSNGGSPGSMADGVSYLNHCIANDTTPELSEVEQLLRDVISGKTKQFSYEYPCHSITEKRWFLMRAGHLPSGGALVTHTNITQRRLAEELANRDQLTQCLNRRGLEFELLRVVGEMRRSGELGCAMLIDFDDFKAVNGQHGFAVGDAVLIEFVQRMVMMLRAGDVFARIGGNEFVVLLPSTSLSEAMVVAERLRLHTKTAVFRPRLVEPISLTCSIAVTCLDEDTRLLEDLLRLCARGLSSAKQHGKNRVAHDSIESGEAIELRHIAVTVVRQPIVELHTGRTVGFELLSRGTAPYDNPQYLFRRAVENQVLREVDFACLAGCLRRLPDLNDQPVHVNIYPSTLYWLEPAELVQLVPGYTDRQRVCLELSEQEIVGDPSQLKRKMEEVRKLGFRFAFDDVGFGRTCFENLLILEPEVMKIDRRIIDGCAVEPWKARQLERMLRVATILDAEVIVEGVETRADAEICRNLGVIHAQGYLWSRPLPF